MSAHLRKFAAALLLLVALAPNVVAQVTPPNTLVAGTTIKAADLNTNFTTIGNHALDRLAGGTISGNIAVDPGITIDGIDIGAAVCATCAPTFKDLTLSSPATGITVAGVNIVNLNGKIPAVSSTYFASLSGTQLTGIAILGQANAFTSTNSFSNVTTFTGRNDFQSYSETKTVVTPGATPSIDLSLGTHFTYSNTTTPTFSFTNAPTSGKAGAFVLAITGNGTAHAPVWPASVKWAGGNAPTVTTTNTKVDLFTFITYDGGTTWYGLVGGQNF